MDMSLEDYCEWLEELSTTGDTINGKALQKWIEIYAEDYYKKKLHKFEYVSIKYQLDSVSKADRLSIFDKYCPYCGSAALECNCENED